MIRKLGVRGCSEIEDLLKRRCGVLGLEWLYCIENEEQEVEIYVEDGKRSRGCMILFKRINVFITTDSEETLRKFLKALNEDKGYAFRCPEWMASTVMDKFRPKEKDYKGVILLTYYTSEDLFRKYVDKRYKARRLHVDTAHEIHRHASRSLSIEYVRERIRKGPFYGVFDPELVSWIGTLWESREACEIGFTYTKPEYRGRGLIKVLASLITEKTLEAGKTPIIHTVETNTSAIRAFEALGYCLGGREWAYYSQFTK